MIKETIIKIINKGNLNYDEAYAMMSEVMSGESSQVQNAAFLAAMSTGSTEAGAADEISGCTVAVHTHTIKVEYDKPALEIVGTGGDGAKAFNISSISALIAATTGIKVTEHDNRVTSSDCDSADFLEASGINIDQDPELCKKLLDEINICSPSAQHHYASTKYIGAIHRGLGLHTVFNTLGSLMNPASPQYFVSDVYDKYLVRPLADVLKRFGVEGAFVVYNQGKTDEVSTSAPSAACEFRNGSFRSAIVKPEDFGLQHSKKEELADGDPAGNVQIARGILSGEERDTCRTTMLLDAGAALYIDGKARNLKEDIQLAGRPVGGGKVLEAYKRYIRLSNEAVKRQTPFWTHSRCVHGSVSKRRREGCHSRG